ncbi:uncharacterized, partial [Tachysurus ichikawai]
MDGEKEHRGIECEKKRKACSADGAGVVLAGLHFPLQQLDYHCFSQ